MFSLKKTSLEKHLGKTVLLSLLDLFNFGINIGNDENDWMDVVDDNWVEQLLDSVIIIIINVN